MFKPYLNRNIYRLYLLEQCFLKPRKLKYKIEKDDKHICELVIHFRHTRSYYTTFDLIHPNEIKRVCEEVYKKLEEEQKAAVLKEEYIYG